VCCSSSVHLSSALLIRARARIHADGIMQGGSITHIINGGTHMISTRQPEPLKYMLASMVVFL
jgi:hypothetical protein